MSSLLRWDRVSGLVAQRCALCSVSARISSTTAGMNVVLGEQLADSLWGQRLQMPRPFCVDIMAAVARHRRLHAPRSGHVPHRCQRSASRPSSSRIYVVLDEERHRFRCPRRMEKSLREEATASERLRTRREQRCSWPSRAPAELAPRRVQGRAQDGTTRSVC